MQKLTDLLEPDVRTIAFVGAGGKTTTIYNLALQLIHQEKTVIITTTTHIYQPCNMGFTSDLTELKAILKDKKMAVAGKSCENGKLKCLDSTDFNQLCKLADYILIEADGAKKYPLKVPNNHEPVIPEWIDLVVSVVGIDCIGQNIKKVCFRTEEAIKLLSEKSKEVINESHIVTEDDVAFIILSKKGLKKLVGYKPYKVIINKVDNEKLKGSAERIKKIIKLQGIEACLLTSYDEHERY